MENVIYDEVYSPHYCNETNASQLGMGLPPPYNTVVNHKTLPIKHGQTSKKKKPHSTNTFPKRSHHPVQVQPTNLQMGSTSTSRIRHASPPPQLPPKNIKQKKQSSTSSSRHTSSLRNEGLRRLHNDTLQISDPIPNPIPSSMPLSTGNTQNVTIGVNIGNLYSPPSVIFSSRSLKTKCTKCQYYGKTSVMYKNNHNTHLCAFVLCLVGWCCCACIVPYVTKQNQTAYHYCKHCRHLLGVYKPKKFQ